MICNVGKTDRALRMAAGVVILGLGLFTGSLWGLIGVVPLATGALRWCPVYVPLKFSSCEKEQPKS